MNTITNEAIQAFIADEKNQRTLIVLARLQAGETAYAIAKDIGITKQAVAHIKNKYL